MSTRDHLIAVLCILAAITLTLSAPAPAGATPAHPRLAGKAHHRAYAWLDRMGDREQRRDETAVIEYLEPTCTYMTPTVVSCTLAWGIVRGIQAKPISMDELGTGTAGALEMADDAGLRAVLQAHMHVRRHRGGRLTSTVRYLPMAARGVQ